MTTITTTTSTKICTACGLEKPLTKEFYYFDNHNNRYVAKCIPCKLESKIEYQRLRYAKQGKEDAKKQYKKHREKRLAYAKRPEVVEKRKEIVRNRYAKDPEKFLAIGRKWENDNREKKRLLVKKSDKKRIDNLCDGYVVQLICNYLSLPRKTVKENPELIELYRSHVQLKRKCQQQSKTSTT